MHSAHSRLPVRLDSHPGSGKTDGEASWTDGGEVATATTAKGRPTGPGDAAEEGHTYNGNFKNSNAIVSSSSRLPVRLDSHPGSGKMDGKASWTDAAMVANKVKQDAGEATRTGDTVGKGGPINTSKKGPEVSSFHDTRALGGPEEKKISSFSGGEYKGNLRTLLDTLAVSLAKGVADTLLTRWERRVPARKGKANISPCTPSSPDEDMQGG